MVFWRSIGYADIIIAIRVRRIVARSHGVDSSHIRWFIDAFDA